MGANTTTFSITTSFTARPHKALRTFVLHLVDPSMTVLVMIGPDVGIIVRFPEICEELDGALSFLER